MRLESFVYAVLLLLLVSCLTVVLVYVYSVSLGSRIEQESGRIDSSSVLRVLDVYAVKMGGVWVGVIHLYASSGVEASVDKVYFLEPDGSLAVVADPVLGYRLHPGINRVAFVVTSGEFRPTLSYAIRLGLSSGRVLPVSGLVKPSVSVAKRYHVYLVRMNNTYCSQYVSDPVLLQKYLSIIGEVEVVDDVMLLQEILEHPNDTVIIVNLHGESVPSPPWVWRGAGYLDMSTWVWMGNPPDWLSWFRMIREAILDGVIWVNVGGWPFYYIFNDTCDRSLGFYEIGIEWFDYDWRSWAGYHGYDYIVTGVAEPHSPSERVMNCYLPVPAVFRETTSMKTLSVIVKRLVGLEPPASHINDRDLDRPCKVQGFAPRAYYVSIIDKNLTSDESLWGVWYGAYAFRLGRGWVVHVGFGPTISEEERAAIILATLIDIIAGVNR